MINDTVYNEIIYIIEENMNDLNLECAGSEMILFAIVSLKESMSSLIFKELNITADEIKDIIKSFSFLRKDNLFTDKFYEVMNLASKLSERNEYAYDEAYLYSLLEVKNTVALDILNLLNVDIDVIYDELDHARELLEKDSKILVNLTRLAKEKKLSPFIGRFNLIDKLDRILSRKQKNNPMLIGEAGVGKSGLVEGLVEYYLTKYPKKTIYRLDLSFLIAGTRYRGDLEERLMDTINDLKDPNKIVFIDEIHNIVASNSNESSLDVANLLKPVLSRSEIKCIGATTADEYYRYIAKDKALVRRFQNIYVDEVDDEECKTILQGIKDGYSEFYNCTYSDEVIEYIIKVSKLMTSRRLPDKAIDLIDEAGLLTSRNYEETVKKETVLKLIFENIGLDIEKIRQNLNKKVNFEKLKPFVKRYISLQSEKNIINIETSSKDLVISDLKKIFNIKDEAILEIDLNDYIDNHYASSLIGAPSGYVGYESGGILTEHLIKHSFNIVIFKNMASANKMIVEIIKRALENNYIIDNKTRKISLKNSIFIFTNQQSRKKIGYFNEISKEKQFDFIDIIL